MQSLSNQYNFTTEYIYIYIDALKYSFRYYSSPVVADGIVRHEVQAFIDNIDKSLSVGPSRCNTLYFKFSHDVYRMLFESKESLNEEDFCTRYFPPGWDCNYRKCGNIFHGCKILYPIECKLYINWNKKNRYFKDQDGKFVRKFCRNAESYAI